MKAIPVVDSARVRSPRRAWMVLAVVLGACGRGALVDPQDGRGGTDASDTAQPDSSTSREDGAPAMETADASPPPTDGPCPAGLSVCGQGDGLLCHDLSQSSDNCGACGRACAPGLACQAGACQQYRCKGALSFRALAFNSIVEPLVRDFWPVLGDFDGDGILDVVAVRDANGPLNLLYGAGDGTFPTGPVVEAPGGRFWRGSAADLDGDGLLDLASISDVQSTVNVGRGSGKRTAPFGETTAYPTSGDPSSLLVTDLDSDGRLDVVAGVGEALEYWLGRAGGALEHQATLALDGALSTYATTPPPVAADWNGDGVPDLVYPVNGLHYRLGRGDGSFDAEVACGLAPGVVGDFNHDNRLDLVSRASLLLGLDDCHADTIVALPDWPKQGGVAFADFTGDGNLDIVADSNTNIIVRVGDGQGGFAQSLSMAAHADGQWPIGVFRIGDLNRDGKLDFVFTRTDGWGVFLNTCP